MYIRHNGFILLVETFFILRYCWSAATQFFVVKNNIDINELLHVGRFVSYHSIKAFWKLFGNRRVKFSNVYINEIWNSNKFMLEA